MSQNLVQLVYVSEATTPFTLRQIDELAARSAARNEEDGITGFLVHHLGHFFQMLEGPEAKVRATYARIQQDPRHTKCETLYDGPTDRQVVGSWFMRNVVLDAQDPDSFDPQALEYLREAVVDGVTNRAQAARSVRNFVRVVSERRATADFAQRRDDPVKPS